MVLIALVAACDSPSRPSPIKPDPGQNWPNLAGTYALTFSMSTSCLLEFPDSVRSITYPATIAQVGSSVWVTVHSKYPGYDNFFSGAFQETNDVIFQLTFEDWWLECCEYRASGKSTTTVSADGLSGLLDGDIKAIVHRPNQRVLTCTARDHSVVFTRQL